MKNPFRKLQHLKKLINILFELTFLKNIQHIFIEALIKQLAFYDLAI